VLPPPTIVILGVMVPPICCAIPRTVVVDSGGRARRVTISTRDQRTDFDTT
jgi:hypothetical protein